ncbi:hypothetical protein EHQ16_15870 [Leptospira kanakyensis]|uniref:Dolichyl-phosphate-mannose--protein mannosyltransferase n=1 Tax=Leptospira kanakyensis TaxID=2484968 RepID=A0A6N4QL38_9LEPT|nr:hypothetical protein [Leptospira kanakyensis]TGK53548.1 hypothetical protein EHQ11_04180 [Leptospira kanakyensis]TGK57343.1 hypothetical protein EHQ16_15870 [Leptospira kanakyensis]TGK73055.1 hypothetical protein EHQ18_04255 [Leptospira kanakyensis]
MFPRPPSILSYFIFFFISSVANFTLCETIYFEPLHSADQLYLPLFLKDIVTGLGIGHWYLPPSPYFFPDLLIYLILYPVVPFLYLPSVYGTIQMILVFFGIYIFLSKYTDQTRTFQFLYLLEILFIFFSLLGYITEDKPLPLVYFLTGAHHSTGFFFSLLLTLYLYSLLIDKDKKNRYPNSFLPLPMVFFFFFSFVLLYISDRFSFLVGVISFFVVRIWDGDLPFTERISYFRNQKFWILTFFFLLLCELISFGLRTIVSIPSSFQILFAYLEGREAIEILHLSGTYLWDFSKHIFYQGKSLLILLGFVLLGFTKFPKLNRHLLIVFFPVLLGLLLLVGRFTYLHPYPIRYLFPILFFGLLGVTWALVPRTKIVNPKVLTTLLLLLVGILWLLPFPREKTKVYFSGILHREVSYDLEKPIRFWTEGSRTPIPIDKDGKPYRWITGAYHTHLTE